ncbi:hypothetical protein [uncultured Nocardioides sp.]|uniref:hypothetical protein n=1 Tax=uncultured Nocardioides sp. TaxID=198441 RepID=UPI0030F767FD
MTATVIDLTSRIRNQAPTCQCREGFTCYPHRVADLAEHLRERDTHLDVELLVPAAAVSRLLAEAIDVLDGITNDCHINDYRRTAR